MVIANFASLEGLENLHLTSQDNEVGHSFVNALLNLGKKLFINGFIQLRMINMDAPQLFYYEKSVLI